MSHKIIVAAAQIFLYILSNFGLLVILSMDYRLLPPLTLSLGRSALSFSLIPGSRCLPPFGTVVGSQWFFLPSLYRLLTTVVGTQWFFLPNQA